jgi:hypothetical protein
MNNEGWLHGRSIAEKTKIGKWKLQNREKNSNEEIEDEEEEAQKKEKDGTVDSSPRKVRYGAEKRNGNGFESGFFSDGIERASRDVAGEVAAEKRKFILEPHEEIAAAAPNERGTSHK